MATPEITGSSTMQEVLDAFPGAQRALMRRYHIGGCSSCGFDPSDRLIDVLKKHNVLDVGEVIAHVKQSHEEEQRLQMDPLELSQVLQGDTPPRLIDVREEHEQSIAKIDGSLPATEELLQEIMETWARDAPIVTYCHHGIRSLDAASYLMGHGLTNVRSLRGGIDAWAEQVDPSMARY